MRPNEMHRAAHRGSHSECAPKGWHAIPNVSGDYDFDATLLHRSNPDMIARLNQHLAKGPHTYRPRRGD